MPEPEVVLAGGNSRRDSSWEAQREWDKYDVLRHVVNGRRPAQHQARTDAASATEPNPRHPRRTNRNPVDGMPPTGGVSPSAEAMFR
jgi:hypothetical protein